MSQGDAEYPGQRFGLPEEGPGSIAHFGRRLVALLIDWAIASVLAIAVARDTQAVLPPTTGIDWLPLVMFALVTWMSVGFIGCTIGHRCLGLFVVRDTKAKADLGRAALRTLLILLVVPALIHDSDGRGLHDRIAGTMIVRTS